MLLLLSTSTVNVCSLLQETLIGVWAQAERTNERASEQESEWTSERARKRRSEGKTGLNRERVLQMPTDAGTDQTPDPNTHSYPTEGPEARGGEAKPGAGVRGQGSERWLSFFFVCCLRWQKKNNCLDQRTTKTTEHPTGRLMAWQTGRRDERITSHWGKRDSNLGVKPASGQH